MYRLSYALVVLMCINGLLFSCKTENSLNSNQKHKKNSTERIQDQVQSDIKHYVSSLNNEDFDQMLSMTYPKIFSGKDVKKLKEELILQRAAGFKKEINLKSIDDVSKPVLENDTYYVHIECTGDVSTHLNNGLEKNIDYIRNNLQLSYDSNEVRQTANTVTIDDALIEFIAVSKKGSNFYWEYIEVDRQKSPMYNRIIPQNVLDAIM